MPAYKVQAYLHDCLRSVLGQDFTDFELIVVDDHSPDGCGTIIDEVAARDTRVVPVRLAENVGLGRARNAGLNRAHGDYLVFLDGDDTLSAGSLRAMAERLKETGEPQLLVYDYARVAAGHAAARYAYTEALGWLDLAAASARTGEQAQMVDRLTAEIVEAAGWSEAPGLTPLPVTREIQREDFDLRVRG